jgi:hypothetical protein
LPDFEDPVVVWQDGGFWFQKSPDTLAQVSLAGGLVADDPLRAGSAGELAALVFTDSYRLVGLRANGDSLLLNSGGESVRRNNAEICAACGCGSDNVAVSYTDGNLVIYDLSDGMRIRRQMQIGLLRGTLGWDGTMLLWLSEDNVLFAYNPDEARPVSIENSSEIIPEGLHLKPNCWSRATNGLMMLLSSHNLVSFRIQKGRAIDTGKFVDLFGGRHWRGVLKRQNDHFLIISNPVQEVLLERDVLGRLFCAPDGRGKFFAISGYGPGWILDLRNTAALTVINCPIGVNVVAGENLGGCWIVDREGNIYFADDQGQTRLIEHIRLPEVSGARLYVCGDNLVWFGNTTRSFPDSAAEAARTFVFFRKSKERPFRIRRTAEQFRHPREGLCMAICYDSNHDRLVTLWKKEGQKGYLLKSGRLEDFEAWQVENQDISGFGGSGFVKAALTENGGYLGVLNLAGELTYIRVEDGKAIATLAGSLPFTLLAPASGDDAFWLSDAQSKIYHCQLRRPS